MGKSNTKISSKQSNTNTNTVISREPAANKKSNEDFIYINCAKDQKVVVNLQGWHYFFANNNNPNGQWILDQDKNFITINFPVYSTVEDLIQYIETERWKNLYQISCVYQTPFFTGSISPLITGRRNVLNLKNSPDYQFHTFDVIPRDHVLPMISHWDCYWNLDTTGIGYLFRLNKEGYDFDNTFPRIHDVPFMYSMQKFLTGGNKLTTTEILIKANNFHVSKEICSVRSPGLLKLMSGA